jgi:hypothetical protein
VGFDRRWRQYHHFPSDPAAMYVSYAASREGALRVGEAGGGAGRGGGGSGGGGGASDEDGDGDGDEDGDGDGDAMLVDGPVGLYKLTSSDP